MIVGRVCGGGGEGADRGALTVSPLPSPPNVSLMANPAVRTLAKQLSARTGSDDDSIDVSGELKGGVLTAASSEKLIKHACRHGLSTDRGNIWMRLASATDSEERYLLAVERVFGAGNEKPSKVYRVRRPPP